MRDGDSMGARFCCSFYVPMRDYSETNLYKKVGDFYASKGHKLIKKEGKFLILDYDAEWGTSIKEPKNPIYDNLLVTVAPAKSFNQSFGKRKHAEFDDCWVIGSSINQETYIDGYGGEGEVNARAILKNRKDFVTLMKELFLYLDAKDEYSMEKDIAEEQLRDNGISNFKLFNGISALSADIPREEVLNLQQHQKVLLVDLGPKEMYIEEGAVAAKRDVSAYVELYGV